MRQDEKILLHVGLAHVLGQAGGGRLLAGELVGRLLAVADRQGAVKIQLAGFFDPLDQFFAVNFAQGLAGDAGLAHVALQQPAVGLADFGDRLAGHEVDDRVHFSESYGLPQRRIGMFSTSYLAHAKN